MTVLELTPVWPKMMGVVIQDALVVWKDTFNPDTVRGRKGLLSAAKITDPQALAFIGEARRADRLHSITLVSAPLNQTGPTIRVRGIDQTAAEGIEHDLSDPSRFLSQVLPTLSVDTIAEWKDSDALCCLDVDYHESHAPSKDTLSALVLTRVSPAPLAWHFSKGGGLHLFYVAVPPFTAEELAACAALRFRASDLIAGLELKRVVRGPGKAVVTLNPTQDTATSFVTWLGAPEYDQAEREAWLDKEGMELEGRYNHNQCPINPTPGHASKGQPVTVSEAGVFCHRCAGEGRAFGSRKAGFAPWSAVLGAPSAGDLGGLVRNMIHWGHAKWVLSEKYGIPAALGRLAYSAALKAYHTGKPGEALLGSVFNFHTDDLARANDQWVSVEASFDYPKAIEPLLSALPVCQFVGEDGAIKVNRAAVTELSCPKPLGRYGYNNLKIVHGFKMGATFLATREDQPTVAVVNPRLVLRGQRFIPRYVPMSLRMPEEEAWHTIETVAPGIDRVLVETAICAFACAQETQAGLLPVVFVTGATGTAKTSTIKFAGGIYGAQTGDVIYDPDPARFRQSVRTGARTGPAVLCNEVLKDSARGRRALSPKEALDPLLNMTPDSQSHVLYIGPMKMGRPPAFFLTEPVCPLTMRNETQLARRIRHWRVFGTKTTWPQTIAAAGLGAELDLLRAVSQNMNRACDAILSYVCDRWFSVPNTWDTIADSLGVKTIQDSPDFNDVTPWLREFFRLVCLAPEPKDKQKAMYRGGYKRISRTDGCDPDSVTDNLLTVYGQFTDGQAPADWTKSRQLEEKDWSAILGTDEQVWFDLLTDGSAAYCRFRVGPSKIPTKVNEQIVDPTTWEALL